MTLTVSAEGYEPADTTVILQLSAQEEQRYEARLRPLQEVRREKRTRVAGWWLVAAGSAAAGLGAAMLAVNLRQLRQARNCDAQQSSTACTEVQGGDAARRMVGGAAALTVGGLALGATGLTLALRPAAKGSTLLLRKDF